MSESKDDHVDFDLHMSWSLAPRVALSWTLLLACVIKIVMTIHDRDIRLNRISLVPFYAATVQSLMMIVYYTLFSVFDITGTLPCIYNCWRNILSSGTCVCFCLIVFVINTYGHLLHKLLMY